MTRRLADLCGLLGVLWPAVAAAQATLVVTPTVHLDAVHDTNVLWRPTALEDDVWRLTPSLQFVRDSPRSRWLGDFAVDAEWYAQHTDLSTPLARQHAALRGHVRPTERVTFELAGAYDSSIRPAELNLLTGLTPGRVRGNRWVGSAEATYAATPRTALIGRGQSAREDTETVQAFIQEGEIRVRHAVNDRDGFHVRYLHQYFTFELGSLPSHVVTAGWTRRLTPSFAVEVDGGTRRTFDGFRPEVDAGASYRGRSSEIRLRYVWTHTTALGALSLVEAQGGLLTVRYSRPQGLSASIDAAVHRNALGTERGDVYHLATEILKPVIGPLAIAAGWSFDHHRGLLASDRDDVPGPLAPVPVRIQEFTRHVVFVRVVVSGSVRSMTGPREPAAARPGGEGEAPR
jgi:hypothetical protein